MASAKNEGSAEALTEDEDVIVIGDVEAPPLAQESPVEIIKRKPYNTVTNKEPLGLHDTDDTMFDADFQNIWNNDIAAFLAKYDAASMRGFDVLNRSTKDMVESLQLIIHKFNELLVRYQMDAYVFPKPLHSVGDGMRRRIMKRSKKLGGFKSSIGRTYFSTAPEIGKMLKYNRFVFVFQLRQMNVLSQRLKFLHLLILDGYKGIIYFYDPLYTETVHNPRPVGHLEDAMLHRCHSSWNVIMHLAEGDKDVEDQDQSLLGAVMECLYSALRFGLLPTVPVTERELYFDSPNYSPRGSGSDTDTASDEENLAGNLRSLQLQAPPNTPEPQPLFAMESTFQYEGQEPQRGLILYRQEGQNFIPVRILTKEMAEAEGFSLPLVPKEPPPDVADNAPAEPQADPEDALNMQPVEVEETQYTADNSPHIVSITEASGDFMSVDLPCNVDDLMLYNDEDLPQTSDEPEPAAAPQVLPTTSAEPEPAAELPKIPSDIDTSADIMNRTFDTSGGEESEKLISDTELVSMFGPQIPKAQSLPIFELAESDRDSEFRSSGCTTPSFGGSDFEYKPGRKKSFPKKKKPRVYPIPVTSDTEFETPVYSSEPDWELQSGSISCSLDSSMDSEDIERDALTPREKKILDIYQSSGDDTPTSQQCVLGVSGKPKRELDTTETEEDWLHQYCVERKERKAQRRKDRAAERARWEANRIKMMKAMQTDTETEA